MWKLISADLKANVKQQEINYLVAVSYKFLQQISSNLKYNVQKGDVFLFHFGSCFIHLGNSLRTGGICLTDKIC